VPCGSDGGYLVYDVVATPPKLLLTVVSPDADSIEPMFWSLAYALPPPGSPRDFFFVLSRLTPWCQSAERRMQILALRPTSDPARPDVMLDATMNQHLLKPFALDVSSHSIVVETDDGLNASKRRWRVKEGSAVELAR
jgi:hypothetical protein